MPDLTGNGWLPFVTLIMGYGVKSLEDWIQHNRAMTKERETRLATRHDQRVASRNAFQRDTLLQLQDAVQKLARATGRTNHLDEMAYRKSKEWRKEQLSEELDQEYFVAQTQASLLASRVRDDSVREMVATFRAASTDVVLATSHEQASRTLQTMIAVNAALHDRIGELIRTIDDDEG